MLKLFVCLIAGALFGVGLALAGMTNPVKVLDFLDVAGHWDPSLAFVMGGAVMVTLVAFALVLKRGKPWLAERFYLPSAVALDRRLIAGAAIFGVGWGLTGYCPGPALASVLSSNTEVWLFVPAMLLGGWLDRTIHPRHK
ncbi:YeeE/YedE family protein [Aquabacterium sp.]|uniref:YeeE/YedE family protein n=1 Tax=Aquabacterium sp. TaxID=1872578 RepID=UPI002E308C54|nr:YeeE/YedE family protein [Aquabacterium sp.]HEX5310946.1 YeeE/YedE family protein [Aquabacterium sp.]